MPVASHSTPASGLSAPVDLVEALRTRLLPWYAENMRDLPWRRTRDPYKLVAAELMLQQTGVQRIAEKWGAFVERFPSWQALAAATPGDVIRAWRGLGYNRRAISMHRIAQDVVSRFGGMLPADRATLLTLPGIGPYTANAILSFVHGHDVAAVDTNLRRVIGRVAFGTASAPEAAVQAVAQQALPSGRSSEWNQALMDFASIQCTVRRPTCLVCPLRDVCVAANTVSTEGPVRCCPETLHSAPGDSASPSRSLPLEPVTVEYRPAPRLARLVTAEKRSSYIGSARYLRGRIVDLLRQRPVGDGLTLLEIEHTLRESRNGHDVAALMSGLVRDGLAVERPADAAPTYRLP